MFIDVSKIKRYDGSCCGYKLSIQCDKHDHEYLSEIEYELDDSRIIEFYFTRATVGYLVEIANFIKNNEIVFATVRGNIPTVLAENIRVFMAAKYNIVVGINAEED